MWQLNIIWFLMMADNTTVQQGVPGCTIYLKDQFPGHPWVPPARVTLLSLSLVHCET